MAKNNATGGHGILAAGCLCWRRTGRGLEVLVIHRPRYDDWSWPKGKQDDGETLPETAVRELREETGLDVRLGVPLPSTEYRVKGQPKLVRYWAAEAAHGARARPDRHEVDELRWVSPQQAHKLLTNREDRGPLKALVEFSERDRLATRPVIVVRHAKAKPRSAWQRAEGDRPLAATGKRQALAVTRLLAAWRPTRMVTSPWLRCLSTVMPYAQQYGAKLKERPQLTEAAHERHPGKAAAVVEKLFTSEHPVALCTHRPVLPTVLEVLAGHLPGGLRRELPDADPYLSPGQLIVLQVPRNKKARAVSCEIITPFED